MNKHVRTVLLTCIDAVIIAISVYIAYMLRFDFKPVPDYISISVPYVLSSQIIITILCLFFYKIYKRVWQYASIGDILSIIKAVAASIGSFFLIHHFIVHNTHPELIIPRSIYVIYGLLLIIGLGGSRLAWRMIRDNYIKIQPHHKRALIVGAGSAGSVIVKELKHSQSELYPIAFIDDDLNKKNLEILGIPVVGPRAEIPHIVEKLQIDDIIIALPTASKAAIADIIEIAKTTSCQIKMVPRMNDLINGKITVNTIRYVSVEDLLGREPVVSDLNLIAEYLSDNIVLVTGAGGSIGSELCRQIASFFPRKLILLGHGENSIYEIELELRKSFPMLELEPVIADIQDRKRIEEVFAAFKPNVVFHAAAHKHVPMMERNAVEAIKNNVFGTKNVAECAHQYGASKFVMISTDKAVNPTNVMGTTKRIAEMLVQSLNLESDTKFSAVRFGNVLGSRGSVIPVFKKQIEQGGPVTVTDPDMVRYFMTIPEAVQLVIQTGAFAEGGEVFILDMGKPVKIADLAKDLIRLSGLELGNDIEIVYTGIRPGEKLFEELLSDEEGASATKHDRIYVGKPDFVSYAELIRSLGQVEQLISKDSAIDLNELKFILKSLVPSYHWYDAIDQKTKSMQNENLNAALEIVASLDKK